MLLGRYFSRLTVKGRTALPIRYRQEIGERVVIARWYEGCLVVVGLVEWNQLLGRLTKKVEVPTQPVRDTDRFILGSAYELKLDSQGRFVIPKYLRDYAELKDEIVFLGLGDRIEVWDKNTWEKQEKFIQEHAEEMIEQIAKEKRGVVKKD